MSFESVAWALEQPVGGTQKIILIGIASHADRYGDNAWPSIETLAKYAAVNIRNARQAINALVESNYIFREINGGGSRKTLPHMRPNLYRLNMAGKPIFIAAPPVASDPPYPLSPATPPVASDPPPPVASDRTPLSLATPEQSYEPSIEQSLREKSACAPTMPDVPADVLADFLKIRSAKKAPLTQTAIRGIQREADKAGLTLTQAVEVCCELGWQAFNAGWYADRQARKPQGGAGQQAESFAERERRHKREQWEDMTGRKWDDDQPGTAPAESSAMIDIAPAIALPKTALIAMRPVQ